MAVDLYSGGIQTAKTATIGADPERAVASGSKSADVGGRAVRRFRSAG